MAAMVEAASSKLLVNSTSSSCLSSNHTTTRRRSGKSGRPAVKGLKWMISSRRSVAPLGHRAGFDRQDVGVGLESTDEENTLSGPTGIELVVGVTAVHRHDASLRKIKPLGHFNVSHFTLGHQPKDRQVSVMIQQQVEFHRPFSMTPVRPIKHAGTQLDDRAVETQASVLEAEFFLGTNELELGQQSGK